MIQTTRPPIRVGIAGLGRAGLETLCPQLELYPSLYKITAVCDPLKERRDVALVRYPQARSYRRYEDLLADSEVELIVIATRSDDHAKMAMQALKIQKWVLVERPFCTDHDEAMVLRAASIKAGNRLLVYHNYRWEPAFMQVKAMMDAAELGEIYDIKIRRGCYERRDDWQAVKRCGGGAALQYGTAFLDQALDLLHVPPVKIWADFKRVAAMGDAEDYFRVILKSLSGVTVDLEVSGGRIGNPPLFVVTGTKGEFTLFDGATEGTLRYLNPKQKLVRRRSSVRTPPLLSETTPEKIDWLEKKIPIAPRGAGMTMVLEHVYSTIRENRPFPVPLDVAIEAMRIISVVKKESLFA